MLTLYKLTFRFKWRSLALQPVLVSAPNIPAAKARARAFIATHYPDTMTFDEAEKICSTPDDVLDWN